MSPTHLPISLECLPFLECLLSYVQPIYGRVGAECVPITVVLRPVVVGVSHGEVGLILDGKELEVGRTIRLKLYIKLDQTQFIRKTCPSDLYPLTSHFHIVKLGFTGVYTFFLFLL